MSSNDSYTVIAGEAKKGEGAPRRNRIAKELVSTPAGCKTLYESLTRSAEKYADKSFLGTRKLKKKEDREVEDDEGNKKTWTFYDMEPYHFLTFKETFDNIRKYAAGLRSLGLEPVSG